MNVLDVHVSGSVARAGALAFSMPPTGPSRLAVGIRPEAITLSSPAAPGALSAAVVAVEPHGAETHVDVRGDGFALRVRVTGFVDLAPDATVGVVVPPDAVAWFDAESGRAL